MTNEEITSLIKFAKELNRRAGALRLSQAELSRRTALGGAEVISQGYISDILRVGRGDSKKYFRLQRDKVIRLAQSVEWDVDEALDCAGFKGGRSQPEEPPTSDQRAIEAARTGEMIQNWTELSPDRQSLALAIIKLLRAETTTTNTPILDQFPDDEMIEATPYEEGAMPRHRKGGE